MRAERTPRPNRTDRLAAEIEALSRLNDASARLWHISDLKTGLEEILSATIALLGGDMGTVQLLGDDGLLRIVAQHGFDERFLEVFRALTPDQGAAAGRALRSRRRVVVEDVEVDEVYAPLRATARAAGYRGVQATPLLSRTGRTLGMIATHFRSPHHPTAQALRLLDLYVQQAVDFIERCQGEQSLRESEQRFKSLSEIVPGTILWASEPDGKCSFLSRGWYEHTGQRPEDAREFRWLEPIHPEDRERTKRIFLDATERREAFVLDFRVRRKAGEYRWMLVAGRPRYTESGGFAGLVGSVIDAHERKLAENALRESEALLAGQKQAFQAAMDGTPLAACLHVLVRTAVAHFGSHTRAAFYRLDEETGTLHHVTGMSEKYAQAVMRFSIGPDSLASGLALHRGTPVITPDVEDDPRWDQWRWIAREHGYRGCWSFPVQTPGGPMLGTFSLYFGTPRSPTLEDLEVVGSLAHAAGIVISRNSEAAERARAEQALTEMNRRKDEFLAVLGHELRNPLAPLSTAADLLENARQQPELVEKVRPMMRRQINHLARLVDDLLDVSRISRGYAELKRTPLDLRKAVESAVEQNRPRIAALRHNLIVELGDTPLHVDGDFQRLTQVFCNLLANAAKYSEPSGEIAIRAAQDDGAAFVSIKDRGFGIPKERVAGVFEMFSQVPEHRALVVSGGLGIGLALCRQLVEMHGGAIEVRSEGLGMGSEFVVRLPLVAAARDEAETPATAAQRAAAARRRVLVVDDNADAAATLRMALELQGHEARAVFSGEEAIGAFAEFDAEVVLLDLGMPGMDGFAVAQRIRALPGGRDSLLVALTGWGQDEDRRRTAEAGFDEHLTKPVDVERLAALLAGPSLRVRVGD